MRLDHLLSKEENLSFVWNNPTKTEERSKETVYCLIMSVLGTRNFSVAMRLGVTPVPIPNTMVKTQAADDTALETVWESRWLPNLLKNK